MKGFIEVVDAGKHRHLINIRHIEEVIELNNGRCFIYLMHNCPDANEQDFYLLDEPYDAIKMLIEMNEGAE